MTIIGTLVASYRKLGHKVTDGLTKIGSKINLKSKMKPNFGYSKMTTEMKLRAKMASLAYDKPTDRPKELEGLKLDEEINTKYHMVYAGSKVYLVFRGTAPTDVRDLISDYRIVKGQEAGNERFREALKIADKVHKKYPKKTIVTVGHSLAGAISQYVDREKDYVKESSTWNAGSGRGALERSFLTATGVMKPYSTTKFHHVVGDPISMAGGGAGQKYYSYPKRAGNPHTMDNWTAV